MTDKRYYSLGPEGQFEEHDTADEAKSAAQEWLDGSLEDSLWNEGTQRIEWGELVCRGHVVETSRVSEDEDETGECARIGCDALVDYELREVQNV